MVFAVLARKVIAHLASIARDMCQVNAWEKLDKVYSLNEIVAMTQSVMNMIRQIATASAELNCQAEGLDKMVAQFKVSEITSE